jgi:hypothetical protein
MEHSMKEEMVRFFSDREEELINSLIAFRFARRDAILLVFIAKKGRQQPVKSNTVPMCSILQSVWPRGIL